MCLFSFLIQRLRTILFHFFCVNNGVYLSLFWVLTRKLTFVVTKVIVKKCENFCSWSFVWYKQKEKNQIMYSYWISWVLFLYHQQLKCQNNYHFQNWNCFRKPIFALATCSMPVVWWCASACSSALNSVPIEH